MRATARSRHQNGLAERTMKTQRENNNICIKKMEAQKRHKEFPSYVTHSIFLLLTAFDWCWCCRLLLRKKQHTNGLTQMRLQYFHVSFFSMELGVRVTSTFAQNM